MFLHIIWLVSGWSWHNGSNKAGVLCDNMLPNSQHNLNYDFSSAVCEKEVRTFLGAPLPRKSEVSPPPRNNSCEGLSHWPQWPTSSFHISNNVILQTDDILNPPKHIMLTDKTENYPSAIVLDEAEVNCRTGKKLRDRGIRRQGSRNHKQNSDFCFLTAFLEFVSV